MRNILFTAIVLSFSFKVLALRPGEGYQARKERVVFKNRSTGAYQILPSSFHRYSLASNLPDRTKGQLKEQARNCSDDKDGVYNQLIYDLIDAACSLDNNGLVQRVGECKVVQRNSNGQTLRARAQSNAKVSCSTPDCDPYPDASWIDCSTLDAQRIKIAESHCDQVGIVTFSDGRTQTYNGTGYHQSHSPYIIPATWGNPVSTDHLVTDMLCALATSGDVAASYPRCVEGAVSYQSIIVRRDVLIDKNGARTTKQYYFQQFNRCASNGF